MCQLGRTTRWTGIPEDQFLAVVVARSPLAFVLTLLFEYNAWQFCKGAELRIDVEVACHAVLEAGGGLVGRVVSVEVPGAGQVSFAYVTYPEGNVIELQCWSGAR
jgi:hypothetical protein